MRRLILSAAIVAATSIAGSVLAADVNTAMINASAQPAKAGQWLNYGNDYSEQHYSPLKKITADNIEKLGLAWYGDLAEKGGSYETTPVISNGVIYVTSPWSKVYAFDAKTGKALWKYDPQVPGAWAVNLCCGIVNRGVAVWKDKVIVGTLDGRLIAIDAKKGTKVWETQVTDPNAQQSITGAPRVADGRIFIGEAGSEFHQRGYMSAYDANTGKMLWRWFAVPGDPKLGFEQPELEMAAKTWSGEWWKTGGGGTPWDGILYDPVTDSVIFGTGNGAPWPADVRSPGGGDNLFTASIVSLDAKTGKYKWHYQATPMDSFDFDNTSPLATADLFIDGVKRHVVMQAPKNGVFYVIDTTNGKVISAHMFVPTGNWLTGFDKDNNWKPILNADANYGKTGKGWFIVPFQTHVWNPMAFNPGTNLMYIPTRYGSYGMVAEAGAKMGNQLLSINIGKRPEVPQPKLENAGSYLLAWDPVKQQEAWRAPDGSGNAGIMTTGGNLVFQGTSQGQGPAARSTFSAFRADNGQKVWSVDTQAGIAGGPATYEIDGEQYVAVVAGQAGFGGYWAPNYARLLVYKLGGKQELPPTVTYTPPPLNPPANYGDAKLLAEGEKHYTEHCASCHQFSARVSSLFPDIRYAPALNSKELFKSIVIDGILQKNGMVSFAKMLKPEEAESIRAYVVAQANDLKANPPPAFGPGGPGPGGGGGGGGARGAQGAAGTPVATPPLAAPAAGAQPALHQ
ncbi:MAG TPA: PQQ-dependent dehydrogenase, methanol/ethanol family [Candidatus Acidoferrum sp.]|nr:PQQ-dependent dehydrogenase, methanol/ethanol family [Candidatus Acidoferrum sp.]